MSNVDVRVLEDIRRGKCGGLGAGIRWSGKALTEDVLI